MTPEQDQAITEVRRIMKLHFDSWIVSYRITNEVLRDQVNQDWHGNTADVVGLAAIANARMLQMTQLPGGQSGSVTRPV